MLHPKIPRVALLSGVAALLVTLSPVAAQAGDTAMIRKSVTVRISDLDLTRAADVTALHVRLHRAAAQACSDGFGAGSPRASDPDRDCMAVAIANALETIKPPAVTYATGSKP